MRRASTLALPNVRQRPRLQWLSLVVVCCLAISISGLTRWEFHLHAGAGTAHSHAADHEAADLAERPAQGESDQPLQLHVHDAHLTNVAIAAVALPRMPRLTRGTWVAPFEDSAHVAAPPTPPYRPPIA